jgi:formate hydrogenlyase transcriptional activator
MDRPGGTEAQPPATTFEGMERQGILAALEASNWVVSDAAAKLGLKRTTLNSKMRKLGISRK